MQPEPAEAARASASTVLVAEAEPELGHALTEQLNADGHRAKLALSATHARLLAKTHRPEAIVLGLLDDSTQGTLALLEEIRQGAPKGLPLRSDLPVIVLGSPAHNLDLLRSFEAGADDFLSRPVSYPELRARLHALLRRTTELSGASLAVGPLQVDTNTQTVTLHEHPIELRQMEYLLLLHLAREPSRVFTRDELLQAIWGITTPIATRTLDSHASRLRRKLACDGHRWVINVRGVGYRLT